LPQRREEQEVEAEFGEGYQRYREKTPPFFPRLGTAKEE
jgi:protein-S-isoprenylcysteine O-methyltransferase Ste14